MSQVTQAGVETDVLDPYEIGWYIESADEEIYGPVSRKVLRRFLEERTITPNTLVRHCTQPEARPAADQPRIIDELQLEATGPALGDKLADAWPRKTRDRQALGEDSIPCARHKKSAVLFCVRCHAPYCNRCRAKPFRKQFFLCRKCQGSIYNRRAKALIIDTMCIIYLPIFLASLALAATGTIEKYAALIYVVQAASFVVYLLRDSLFGGAGIGKRAMGLRVVRTTDGNTPLTNGQGLVRWLSQLIPFFNLVDLSVPYRDPLLRRYGDRWAGTRVIDTDRQLAKLRAKLAKLLLRKGVRPPQEVGMTMEGLARTV